jgi:hypothetical protein
MFKLLLGLRQMLIKSFISSDKYTLKDIQTKIQCFFPTLPRRPSNAHHWESLCDILGLAEAPKEKLEGISDKNRLVRIYFNNKLSQFSRDRQMNTLDFMESTWLEVEPKLKKLEQFACSLLPLSYIDLLWANKHPKVQMMASRYISAQDEDQLINFFNYLCDLRVESNFFSSLSGKT